MKQFVSYAQNQEDAILDAYLKDVEVGFYVDIGAHHPTNDSVTKSFYERGWNGINVEPNPELYKLLVNERPRDINIQAAISDKQGKLNLRIYPNSGLSTLSKEMQNLYKSEKSAKTEKYKDLSVPVMPLKQLFDYQKPGHIHFMKVDAEGMEYEVLLGNDWSLYRPEILCVEANHEVKNWKPILEKNDYEYVWNDGLNDYFLAKEHSSRKKNFSYADDMLVDRQVIAHHIIDKANSLAEEAEHEKAETLALRMKVDRLTDDNKLLQEEILKERRLRYAIRNLVVGTDKAILAQIERLRGGPSSGRVVRYNNVGYDTSSAENLLDTIRQADLMSFYSQKKAPRPKKTIVYKTVKNAYFVPRHLMAMLFRAAFRLRKTAKRKD